MDGGSLQEFALVFIIAWFDSLLWVALFDEALCHRLWGNWGFSVAGNFLRQSLRVESRLCPIFSSCKASIARLLFAAFGLRLSFPPLNWYRQLYALGQFLACAEVWKSILQLHCCLCTMMSSSMHASSGRHSLVFESQNVGLDGGVVTLIAHVGSRHLRSMSLIEIFMALVVRITKTKWLLLMSRLKWTGVLGRVDLSVVITCCWLHDGPIETSACSFAVNLRTGICGLSWISLYLALEAPSTFLNRKLKLVIALRPQVGVVITSSASSISYPSCLSFTASSSIHFIWRWDDTLPLYPVYHVAIPLLMNSLCCWRPRRISYLHFLSGNSIYIGSCCDYGWPFVVGPGLAGGRSQAVFWCGLLSLIVLVLWHGIKRFAVSKVFSDWFVIWRCQSYKLLVLACTSSTRSWSGERVHPFLV